MNKAVTDGALPMPPAFGDGLDMWSSGNGTPGSDSYAGSVNTALVAADRDRGGAARADGPVGVSGCSGTGRGCRSLRSSACSDLPVSLRR
jgi:hypothetical protein